MHRSGGRRRWASRIAIVPGVVRCLGAGGPARVAGLVVLILALEYGRVVAAHQRPVEVVTLLVGGAALSLVAVGHSPASLGLGRSRLAGRLLAGMALAAVLLLPAAVRWQGGPELGVPWSVAAIAVSIGEEVAFRGVLFAELEPMVGGLGAVLGSTLAWTAAHALSHPPSFLVAVAACGLLLGLWRWACRDLVAPIVGHVLADLAL
jgi:membrane protease YdiL (CAAX protease family)